MFIGKHLDKEKLLDGFMKCQVGSELRFKVGDAVFAKTGRTKDGWEPAKILKQWDDGNPYRIECIQDGMNCWGPVDLDSFVRRRAA